MKKGNFSKGINHSQYKHGECVNGNSKLYRRWYAMIGRTTNPNDQEYLYYGGRGISVCDEWKISANFFKWAKENGYKESLELDRIDNNKGYYPENCHWVTHYENSMNRRKRPDFGIYKIRNRYCVILRRNNINYFGGSFINRIHARLCRDELFNKLHDLNC